MGKTNRSKTARRKTNTEKTVESTTPKTRQKKRTDTAVEKKSAKVKRTQSKRGSQNIKHRTARKKMTKRKQKRNRRMDFLREIGVTFLIVGLLFFLARTFVFALPRMEGYAMSMTLGDSDRLFVNRLSEAKRFDLIYFRHPTTGELLIRRVIGLSGEEIRYKEDTLYVNGEIKVERFLGTMIAQAEQENHLYTEDFTLKEVTGAALVPKDGYFVLGDNRMYSVDSRTFGFINKSDIVGVVKMKFLPLHEMERF